MKLVLYEMTLLNYDILISEADLNEKYHVYMNKIGGINSL